MTALRLPPSSPLPSSLVPAQASLDRGRVLMQGGDLAGAAEKVRQALALLPPADRDGSSFTPAARALEQTARRQLESIEGALAEGVTKGSLFVPDPPSEILPGQLWQGGSPIDEAWMGRMGITLEIDVADPEYRPEPGALEKRRYLKVPLEDGETAASEALLQSLVKEATDAMQSGGRVLVHCEWGRNRSGLVVARIVEAAKGLEPAAAIELVQSRRHRALNNQAFVRHLLGG